MNTLNKWGESKEEYMRNKLLMNRWIVGLKYSCK